MMKIKLFFILFFFINTNFVFAEDDLFNEWLIKFKKEAISEGISIGTLELVMSNAKFLPNVIKYDRYQPEFYEDTKTYVTKRTSQKKLKNGLNLYSKNKNLINNIEKEFKVEKELLLALMGIETNFGKYLGKMDIISSLATLSYDERRSAFFTNELITILKLIDNKIIDYKTLYLLKMIYSTNG